MKRILYIVFGLFVATNGWGQFQSGIKIRKHHIEENAFEWDEIYDATVLGNSNSSGIAINNEIILGPPAEPCVWTLPHITHTNGNEIAKFVVPLWPQYKK